MPWQKMLVRERLQINILSAKRLSNCLDHFIIDCSGTVVCKDGESDRYKIDFDICQLNSTSRSAHKPWSTQILTLLFHNVAATLLPQRVADVRGAASRVSCSRVCGSELGTRNLALRRIRGCSNAELQTVRSSNGTRDMPLPSLMSFPWARHDTIHAHV